MCEKDQIPRKYYMPIMFNHFVCALLSFCAHEFPAKSESQEPMKLSWNVPHMWLNIIHAGFGPA